MDHFALTIFPGSTAFERKLTICCIGAYKPTWVRTSWTPSHLISCDDASLCHFLFSDASQRVLIVSVGQLAREKFKVADALCVFLLMSENAGVELYNSNPQINIWYFWLPLSSS